MCISFTKQFKWNHCITTTQVNLTSNETKVMFCYYEHNWQTFIHCSTVHNTVISREIFWTYIYISLIFQSVKQLRESQEFNLSRGLIKHDKTNVTLCLICTCSTDWNICTSNINHMLSPSSANHFCF